MQIKQLHNWNLSYSQAIALQKHLSEKVQLIQLRSRPKTIAGLDCTLSSDGQRIIAAAIVLETPKATKGLWEPLKLPDFKLIETTTASREAGFPYIPGLLSFREAPACIAAVEKLKAEPDVFIIDGQGIAHPRRLGLAAHLGLFFDKPTIGCAKSRLTGYFEDPPPEKGAYSLLKDKKSISREMSHESRPFERGGDEPRVTSDEIIGAVVRTRTNVKPVFVSVGNKCLLKDAIEIILAAVTKYRLPEPTRLAHKIVSELRLKALTIDN